MQNALTFKEKAASQSAAYKFGTLYTTAIATSFLLVLTLLAVFWARDRENAAALADETAAIERALRSELSLFESDIRARQLPDGRLHAGLTTVPALPGERQEAVYLVDVDEARGDAETGPPIRAILAALSPILGADQQPAADAFAPRWRQSGASIVSARGELFFAALALRDNAKPQSGPGARLAALAIRPIGHAALADIARRANTARLDLVVDPAAHSRDSAQLAFAAAPGAPSVALAWRPNRPGDRIVETLASLLLGFSTLFAVLIVVHSRRVARDLADLGAKSHAAATQDILTGLPNRFMFGRLLESEIERVHRSVGGQGLAILYVDLDRFKEINDTYGHAAGDRLVVAITQRMSTLLRSSGRLTRIGGDEFAIIQTDVVGPRDAEILARRMLDATTEPVEIGGAEVFISMSIGVALFPHDAQDAEELMRRADLALYRAKNEGRNRHCFYEQRMGEQLKMRKTVEDDLRKAIEDDGLVVQYQPVMAMDGQRMVGVEALVRWPHPEHGLISPTNFITLAEECGLILPLGEWVLRRALQDVKKWPGMKVAVNVSGIQFRQKDFVPTVERLLGESGVDPSQLELELTESILIADADSAEDSMIELRALGVRLALDDFGTGYSSLIYLRRFAFDKIKIDKSFLESVETTGESAIIVHSIVHLGRALGLTVTAEGVETPEQHRFLQALGCHEMQGYLFSRSVSAEDISRQLERQERALAPLSLEPQPARSVA